MPNSTPTNDPKLSYKCPFCSAEPGEKCRSRSGREAQWPHSGRIRLAHPIVTQPVNQALCCACGELRTFVEPCNKRGYFGEDPDWNRALGDLNCSHCGAVTTHALLGDGKYRDIDEHKQRAAFGDATIDKERRWADASVEKFRREYRQGNLPRNPYLHHRWWVADADEVRAAGQNRVTAMCGEVIDLPPSSTCQGPQSGDELVAPEEVRDQEYEDSDTGLWWQDMDCVDCLRVSNVKRLERWRKQLKCDLLDLAFHLDEMPPGEIGVLRERLGSAVSR